MNHIPNRQATREPLRKSAIVALLHTRPRICMNAAKHWRSPEGACLIVCPREASVSRLNVVDFERPTACFIAVKPRIK